MGSISNAWTGIVLGGLLLVVDWPATGRAQELPEEERAAGFISLFNSQDFTGWRFGDESPPKEVPANWKIEEGVIKVTGGGKPYLASAREYGNFELRLEWRGLKEKYNSGLFLRSGKDVGSNQINLAHKGEGAFLGGKVQGAKSVGDLQKPAGEWNEWRVLAVGERLTLWCNGTLAWEATGLTPEKGYLGLQAEGAAMEFRNIRIREIKE
jgi:3-keto-disaccharide hydrolase